MKRDCVAIAVALVALSISGVASADEPSAADIAAARSLSQEGTKLANANKCAEAIDKLSRAEKLFHAPTTLSRLGECQVKVGRVVEGTENLNRVVRETLAPNAPKAFVKAQERAKELLPAARAKIAKLTVTVNAPKGAEIAVRVDGEPMNSANLGTERPVDPGEHTIEASAPGHTSAKAKAQLKEGGAESVTLTIEVDPNAPKIAAAQPTDPKPKDTPPPPPPRESSSKVPVFLAFGVGLVGIGVGATFGVLASGKKSDLDGSCNADKRCPPDQEGTLSSAKTFSTVSTIGFIVGGIGIATGTVLLVTSSGGSKAGSVSPFVGLGNAGVTGSF